MGVDQSLTALLTSAASFAAAIAALWTVRQMSKQHAASYRPELVMRRSTVYGGPLSVLPSSLPMEWKDVPSDATNSHADQKATLQLINIGLGVAKNLTVCWSFDLDRAVEQINSLAHKRSFQTKIFINEQQRLEFVSSEFGNQAILRLHTEKEEFEYLIPFHEQREPLLLHFPHDYQLVVSTLVALCMKDIALSGPHYSFTPPPLTATVSYHDLGNKKHTQVFPLQPNIPQCSGGPPFHFILETLVGKSLVKSQRCKHCFTRSRKKQ